MCSIENFDPMGVHTGDSITVAPAQTLTDREYQMMRDAALACLREIGVDTGGSNVQFAIDPADGRMVIVEMNPRVSRSSALASKATGFPIAKIAAKLAVGYRLDEIKNDITRKTPACFEPTIDYVVVKIPRWQFEKFPGRRAGAGHADEERRRGDGHRAHLQAGAGQGHAEPGDRQVRRRGEVSGRTDRAAADHSQSGPARLHSLRLRARIYRGPGARIDLHRPVVPAAGARNGGSGKRGRESLPGERVEGAASRSKRDGLSDSTLARAWNVTALSVRERRKELGVAAVFNRVDTCAAEFESFTPYLYSSYESECEAAPSDRKKVMILGSGPNRIGQGIEFDYCCCHASFALQEFDVESIMVNCNPETVSTDYDTSDRLYFEPLTLEEVLNICDTEKPDGVIVQFGGQTPLTLAIPLESRGRPDHRHRSGEYRSGRGSQAIRQAAGRFADSVARKRFGDQARRRLAK